MKEGLALNIQVYYEHSCQALIPISDIERAMNSGDERAMLSIVNIPMIKQYMGQIFDQGSLQMNGGPAHSGSGVLPSKNPFVFVEKCSLQFHIFSYRMVDFPSLFNFLNHYLNKNSKQQLEA